MAHEAESLMRFAPIEPAPSSHIALKDPDGCGRCSQHSCVSFCPGGVYSWQEGQLTADYRRCLECLACPFACPHGNIVWQYPPGGYGVTYHY